MKYKILEPNYNRSILSISSSIMKYYGINSNYKSLEELDSILDNKYKNIVFLILDSMGTNIVSKNLTSDSILKQNVITNVTSVFPPTTAAATIAFHSGVSPNENGWIGWMPYFKEYNKIIELFSGKDYYTREKVVDPPENGILKYETIYEKICKQNKDISFHKIFPSFVENGAKSFEELCDNIKKSCINDNKQNLIEAYWTDPDYTIHRNGVDSKEVKKVLKNIDDNLKKTVKDLKDTLIIISADHGAVDVEETYLQEIKKIDECLKIPPSIESRFVTFFIKNGKKRQFISEFKKLFKDDFLLYTKKQFLEKNLLGPGIQHKNINDYIGDYVAISKSSKSIRYSITGNRDKPLIADHGGITEEEMQVPVIVINTTKNRSDCDE